MFGSQEEQNLTLIERQKVSIVASAYKRSPLFFKMFFDKVYRPQRYNIITNQIDAYTNVNEFRTLVMQNYHSFPLKSTNNIFFLYKS